MPAGAPAAVTALASRGRPLSPAERGFFEPRFGGDLGHVRLHSYPEAAALADDAEARAFTIGSHVFFADGAYDPQGGDGNRALLAHELAHVEQAGSGSGGLMLMRTPVCRDLLSIGSTRTSDPIRGHVAHRLITERFILANGPFRRLNIPGAARAPFDTEACSSDSTPSEIDPLIYDERPRSRTGMGIPDLIIRRGNRVEIGEIKPATWGCVVFGEQQVQNYVDKGNADSAYRGRQAIRDFSVMPPASWNALPGHIAVGDVDLLYNWCGQGVVGYLGVRRDDVDTLVCAVSDRGRIDRFVDGLMSRAGEVVESVVNTAINERLTRLIDRLSLEELLRMILGEEAARHLVGPLGPLFGPVRRQIELEIRAALHRLKDEVVRRVREQLRRQLRTMVSQVLTALCATALVLSAQQVLDELRRRMRILALQTAAVVVAAMVAEAVAATLRAIGEFIAENWLPLLIIALCIIGIAILIADDATLIGIADDPAIVVLVGIIRAAAQSLTPLLRGAAFVG